MSIPEFGDNLEYIFNIIDTFLRESGVIKLKSKAGDLYEGPFCHPRPLWPISNTRP